MGFRSGVFHVEARVQNSAKEYREVDGVFDMHGREAQAGDVSQPHVFLIEVNVRPPGLDCAYSTLYTCGVVCTFFAPWRMAQEILVQEDFCQKLLDRAPEVAPFVSRTEMFKHPGTMVSPVHGVEFLAYFLRLLDVAKLELEGNGVLQQ
ncbi:hypothetical protein NLG97_g7504 [Lecanicillium saksenae]|uniref:Uncharacterized protein n=1 Tax=Lecanicillium saksenae TaxID=468837 RepID=A0ACC1QM77_9HYPO|nr:hypothetical protein NLG97_g7504 [Lecanicillium saksenae]